MVMMFVVRLIIRTWWQVSSAAQSKAAQQSRVDRVIALRGAIDHFKVSTCVAVKQGRPSRCFMLLKGSCLVLTYKQRIAPNG